MSNVQTQNIETADVIVVGAGMAGSVMAYQLGLAGLKVLVLESAEGSKAVLITLDLVGIERLALTTALDHLADIQFTHGLDLK